MNSSIDRIPPLAKWKLLILDKGINLSPKYNFKNYDTIEKYKTKFAVKNPTVRNLRVIDTSRNDLIIPSEYKIRPF